MEYFWRIIPHFFLVFAALATILGHYLSFFVTILIGVLLIVYRIPKPDKNNVESILQPHKRSILAHKGGATDAPENTLAAIRLVMMT